MELRHVHDLEFFRQGRLSDFFNETEPHPTRNGQDWGVLLDESSPPTNHGQCGTPSCDSIHQGMQSDFVNKQSPVHPAKRRTGVYASMKSVIQPTLKTCMKSDTRGTEHVSNVAPKTALMTCSTRPTNAKCAQRDGKVGLHRAHDDRTILTPKRNSSPNLPPSNLKRREPG